MQKARFLRLLFRSVCILRIFATTCIFDTRGAKKVQKARDSDKINSITRVKYSYLNPRFILFHFTCIYSKSLVISDFDSFESEDDALPPETVTLSSPERSIYSI